MTKKWTFPFHYGGEAESYTFYRVPKILFTEEVFDHLSTDAKLLYGLLLDRMQLSLKNGWVDEEGKVFIYYTVESIMDALTCGNKKAGQLLAELDETDRKLLLSFSLEGKPTKQIAEELNLTDGQVRVRLHRIRRKLRKGMNNDA